MKNMIFRALLFAMFVASLSIVLEVQSARAAVQDFHLYGSYASGWGFSSGGETSPGPTITVDEGDFVNLTLTNEDSGLYAPSHQFLLSYHNSSIPQSDDMVSPYIAPGATIEFSFTANVSGTFTYYCTVHPDMMYGTFIVRPTVPEASTTVAISTLITLTSAIAIFRRIKSKSVKK